MIKLEKNILELSVADTFEKAKYEWYFFGKYSYKEKKGHCICCSKMKHITFAINKLNGNIIQLGLTCRKKFPNVFIQKKGNKIGKMLHKFYQEQVFEEISDIKEYVEKCMELFRKTYFNNINELSLKECDRYIRDIKNSNNPSLDNLLKEFEKRVKDIEDRLYDIKYPNWSDIRGCNNWWEIHYDYLSKHLEKSQVPDKNEDFIGYVDHDDCGMIFVRYKNGYLCEDDNDIDKVIEKFGIYYPWHERCNFMRVSECNRRQVFPDPPWIKENPEFGSYWVCDCQRIYQVPKNIRIMRQADFSW